MNIFLLGATPSIEAAPGEDSLNKLAKTGGNTGNQLIAYGLLSQIEYKDISWEYRINPKEVHERFDKIVIAAANFLFPKFDFGGMADYIERADLPVAIVGLGAQSNSYDPNIELMPGTERFVKVIAERSVSIGVRGPYTQAVLAQRGVHNVTVTGCPSYYMNGSDGVSLIVRPFSEVKRISVNASRDVVAHSFDKERMKRLVGEIYRAGIAWDADFIAQSESAEIRLAEQAANGVTDASLDEIMVYLRGLAQEEHARRWAKERVKAFFNIESWLSAMSNYDFVFGTRFHGCMAALQCGVPSIVICHDTRTEDMCRFLEVPFVSIMDIDSIDVEKLYTRIEPESLRRRYNVLYPQYRSFLESNGFDPKRSLPFQHDSQK